MPRQMIVSSEEYSDISEKAAVAHMILEEERFKFLRDQMQATMDYASNLILTNAVHEVEETTFGEKLSRMFRISKKEQIDELVGQYKLAKKWFDDLHFYIQTKEDIDKQVSAGIVKVPGDKNG